jgi:uncharacterized membrane protein YoaK (UPF0700 family)
VTDDEVERREVAVLLVVVAATGMIDAACLLHLGVFTAYLTGSFILFGAHLVGLPGSPLPSAIAIAGFVVGSFVGGRLIRRTCPRHRLLGDILVLEALVVLAGAVIAAAFHVGDEQGAIDLVRPDTGTGAHATIGVLALAMGCQMSVMRAARVPDIAMAAGTGVLYRLAADTPWAGGTPQRTLRRLGVVLALIGGAAAGAGLARWEPWTAWAAAGGVVLFAAVLAYLTLPRDIDEWATSHARRPD